MIATAAAGVFAVPGAGSAAPAATGHPHISPRLAATALSALRGHPAAARASAGQQFTVTATQVDRNGASHVRVQRTYDGLPVVGGDLVVHLGPAAGWRGTSQSLTRPLQLSTRPAVSAATAERAALAPTGAARDVRRMRVEGNPELVVDTLSGLSRLAYRVTTGGRHTDGTPSRMLSYVDADTGRVIRREETVETVDGSGQSLYSGTVPLQVSTSGSSYVLNDPTRGNTYTVDAGNKSDSILCTLLGLSCVTGTQFTSSDTAWGTGSNSSRESAAVDAQYGTNMTWDYYKSTFGRAGIFGTGKGSWNRVHYGNGYVNAFWDGTKMTYGDGDGTSYGPLVSLDVAGHEMSHGVTENTAGLTYSGESGGLNEATSDIFGTMVEFYANNQNDPGDYLIGEQFDLNGAKPFRRMDDPASDGSSLNCWSSNAANVDVHYSSGIGNHFFYLLAEGSGAKTLNGVVYSSPTCNNSTVSGIGRDAAQRIWYRALTTYFTSGTNYAAARTATLKAATDLYGATSAEYNAVATAWSAVNVN
ncbi:MAG TPA: M4 family metallopeptidase [Nocardioides sp.]|nr:M4 family metallopeptidase [Nocardioides sp.]